jgi:stalled ribosome rescue protein Dom34
MIPMKNTNEVNNGECLKVEAGLWVDHRKALIVVLSKTGEETKRIQSNAQKQLRRTGEPSIGRFEYQEVPADDSRQRAYSGYLERYYDEIVAYLREAGAILIFGPGEAKGELKKRFEKECPGAHIVTMETTDKMTEPQIVAHVRHHFCHEAARQGV